MTAGEAGRKEGGVSRTLLSVPYDARNKLLHLPTGVVTAVHIVHAHLSRIHSSMAAAWEMDEYPADVLTVMFQSSSGQRNVSRIFIHL